MTRPGKLIAREVEGAQARRRICTPRGAHRLTGPKRTFALAGHDRPMQRCTDCGAWYEAVR